MKELWKKQLREAKFDDDYIEESDRIENKEIFTIDIPRITVHGEYTDEKIIETAVDRVKKSIDERLEHFDHICVSDFLREMEEQFGIAIDLDKTQATCFLACFAEVMKYKAKI